MKPLCSNYIELFKSHLFSFRVVGLIPLFLVTSQVFDVYFFHFESYVSFPYSYFLRNELSFNSDSRDNLTLLPQHQLTNVFITLFETYLLTRRSNVAKGFDAV